MPDVVIIANPISGVRNNGKIVSLAIRRFEATGHEVSVRFTEYPGHAGELASESVASGIKTIVAVGGDGTVNEIASALAGSKSNLGIIPCGSGNGLARHLHIPMDPSKAAGVILEENPVRIDGCRINDRFFFCTFGLGFDAEVASRFTMKGKRGLFNYVRSAISVNNHYTAENYEIIYPEGKIKDRFLIIAVGNASQYGNNAYIAPLASVADGLLDVVLIKPVSLPIRIKMAVEMFLKKLRSGSHAIMIKTREITIRSLDNNCLNGHLDGESMPFGKEIKIKNIPSALNVYVPGRPVRI